MAFGSTKGGSSSGNSSGGGEKKRKKSLGQIIDSIAKWTVLIFTFPIRFMGAIVAQFVGDGGAGKAAVGGTLFLLGCAISTDSLWQQLFGQPALFPWYEANFGGWWRWIPTMLNPWFYVCFILAAGIQVIEGRALKGKSPDAARRDLEDSMQYELEGKPSGKIDLAGSLWNDYKRAGMREKNTIGFIPLALWGFDLIITLAARNPWSYSDPGEVLMALLFNIGTMAAGEIGYAIWKSTND